MKSRSVFLLFFIIGLFLFQITVTYGQVQFEIDSVKKLIRTESDAKVVVDNYNIISDLFTQSDGDSAIYYAQKALDLSKKIQYKWGEAEAYFILSFYHDRSGETEKAIEKLEKATSLFTELGDSSYLIGCYNNLGVFYSYGTDQKKSLEYFIKALNLAKALNESFALSEAYSNIGTYYEYLREYSNALRYYETALQLDIENNNQDNIALSYLYLGNINLKLQRFDTALFNLKKAQEFVSQVKDLYRQAELCINFASYYVETNNPDSVNICLESTQLLNDSLNYQTLEADILFIKGELFLMLKKYAESIRIYDKVETLYEEMQIKDSYYDLYQSKAKAYAGLQLFDKAYELLEKAYKTDELLQPGELAIALGEFEHTETVKEEQARLKLEQELETQKQENE
ncbi:MAG: tetratricopeptide repeat protein, partial [Prolixibacteraceae bacterium]|nr:tetratricopeptide repeat protein [Prolixibacteraceae bacterium]